MSEHSENRPSFPVKGFLIAFAGGAIAGIAFGLRVAPRTDRRLTKAGRTVDDFIEAAREKTDSFLCAVSNLADRGRYAVQRTNCAVNKIRNRAHEAIDETVSVVDSVANTGHNVVNTTANAIRTGLRA